MGRRGLMFLFVAFAFGIMVLGFVNAKWFTGDATSPDGSSVGDVPNAGAENSLKRGDLNKDGKIDQADINFLVNYIFRGTEAPNPMELADVNGDDLISVPDITYLIDYVERGGPAPVPLGDTEEVDYIRGDVNNDGVITISDVSFLVTYLYKNGTAPNPLAVGDVNADGSVNQLDVDYLTNYLFKGGPAPVPMGENSTSQCTDSDGGLDYYVKGSIMDGLLTKEDTCTVGSEIADIMEYYCSESGEILSYPYKCPNGCENGICVKEAPINNLKRGDLNGDGNVDIADLTYLVSYLYKNGTAPNPLEVADVNGDGSVNEGDIAYLTSYLFAGGPAPVIFINQTIASCTDSDGGLDYYLLGKVTTNKGESEDKCFEEGKSESVNACSRNCFVLENYCFGNQAGSMRIRCGSSCEAGVCTSLSDKDRCVGLAISRGDINKDGKVDNNDMNFFVNYLFKNGDAPEPIELGDVNNDGNINVADLTYLVSFLNGRGNAPIGDGITGPPVTAKTRVNDNGVKYCDPISLKLKEAKDLTEDCVNDYECNSNACLDGKCVSITKELEKQQGLLKKIWCWITNLGNRSGFEKCVGDNSEPNDLNNPTDNPEVNTNYN